MPGRCWTYWPQGTAIALCAGGCHPGSVQEGSKQSHTSTIRITQLSDSGVFTWYKIEDRSSKIENFPDKSPYSSSMVSLLPCLWCPGPVVESCDPDIVVTLEHWHNYTLLHHNPHQWHTSTINPTPAQHSRHQIRLFFINNISSQLSGVWRGEEAISNISTAAGSQGLGWNK